MSDVVHSGQCRCGEVRFDASGAPLVTMACHCTGCQRMTGGAYSLSSLYPAERFALTQGKTIRGGMKTGPDHQFCPDCMSWIFTRAEQLEGFVNVRSPMSDDAEAHKPYVEMARNEAVPGAESGSVCSYQGFPEESDFQKLVAGYASWDGRVKE